MAPNSGEVLGNHQKGAETPNGVKFSVLYIEDNLDNLELVREIISRHTPIDLLSANNAKAGLELARKKRPHLILMDIHLPGMDGLTAFEELKKSPETQSIPVIALSADAMESDINKTLQAGFKAYVTKPIDILKFIETLNKELDNLSEQLQ